MRFEEFFGVAMGSRGSNGQAMPYPFQTAFAEAAELPHLLNVPTGVGKTATAVLGWLYRRFAFPDRTPRRLVYCLPMRTLVEQTERETRRWLERLAPEKPVGVHLLMGGSESSGWDEHPEHDAILIGTQDMLLSRALNRGYGMSRYRWPIHFGLLNNDCLWVMDETQLMGAGLTTTAQLQGLRSKLATYGVTHSLWMSATLDTSPIRTVDHPEPTGGFSRVALTDADRKHEPVRKRLGAKKTLEKSKIVLTAESEKKNYARELAAAVKEAHQAGTLTLIVMNRVARAQEVFAELQKLTKSKNSAWTAELALIHARFRPHDRRKHEQSLVAETMPEAGRIVVATQAIEAGVDVSAATMFTELAPWPSLVQRFGRCNRGGEFTTARVVWIDWTPKDDKGAVPYVVDELDKSRQRLESLADVGPATLEAVKDERPAPVVHTLRRKDLLDLWDTTPDLAGNDLDISRFIRDADDNDVQFFWREWDGERPPADFPNPERHELCSVRIGPARDFIDKLKSAKPLVWDPLHKEDESPWRELDAAAVRPGLVLLLRPQQGGYKDDIGWTGDVKDRPQPTLAERKSAQETMGDDALGNAPQPLSDHLQEVARHATSLREALQEQLADIPWDALSRAALWHDVGKAHSAFQMAMRDSPQLRESTSDKLWAKSGAKGKPNYRMPDGTRRNGFRHELASALAWLIHHGAEADANLIAFLIAAHHGKVRGSIRSLPNETRPTDETIKFARGVWDGDELPPVELGNGETVPATPLDLDLMKLGESAVNGESKPSWLARVLQLRDELEGERPKYGPFRLSYLETLLRIADWRGSKVGGQRNDQ